MNRSVYRIVFRSEVDMAVVEDTLLTAVLSVGCIHGQAALRLEVSYAMDAKKRSVVIDATDPLGQSVARVFVGMCSHEFGDTAYSVSRAGGPVAIETVAA